MRSHVIEGLKGLSWSCFRFVLKVETPFVWHKFPGAALRDEFGRVLKNSVCLHPSSECSACLLRPRCVYPQLFAPAPPPDAQRLRNLSDIPRPFVVEPLDTGHSESLEPGARIEFRLMLVGQAIDQLPYFLVMYEKLGRDGFGPARGTFTLDEVLCDTSLASLPLYRSGDTRLRDQPVRLTVENLVPRIERELIRARGSSHPIGLRVDLCSPTEIRRDGKPCRELSLDDLVRSVLRRLSNLAYFHCGAELDIDFPAVIALATNCRMLSSDVRWHSQRRLSRRQHQSIPMGGLVGTIEFRLPDQRTLDVLLPYLTVGESFHVGKGCVMGLGRYQVVASAPPREQLQ